jgi:hypothetical protein
MAGDGSIAIAARQSSLRMRAWLRAHCCTRARGIRMNVRARSCGARTARAWHVVRAAHRIEGLLHPAGLGRLLGRRLGLARRACVPELRAQAAVLTP